jgi:hypothetical protein
MSAARQFAEWFCWGASAALLLSLWFAPQLWETFL